MKKLKQKFFKGFLFLIVAMVSFFLGSSIGKVFYTKASAATLAEERIISLHPVITENIFALGRGDSIVGATEFSNYPEEAKKIPRVGDVHFNLEKIISLKPTLVLAMKQPNEELKQALSRAGIRYESYRFEKLSDFEGLFNWLGKQLDASKKVLPIVNQWKKNWAPLSNIKPTNKKVFIEVEQQPLIAAGGDTFLSEIVERCGLQNTFSHLKGYVPVSREAILSRRSDKVLILLEGDQAEARKMWDKINYHPRILLFDPNTISRLTPRLPEEAKKLCSELNKNL